MRCENKPLLQDDPGFLQEITSIAVEVGLNVSARVLVRDTNAHLAFSVSLFASPEQHGLYTKWGKQLAVSGRGKK